MHSLLAFSSKSSGTGTESDSFIDKTFTFLKQNEHFKKIKTEHFKFVHVTENLVEKLTNKMNVASGAGLSEIPIKVIKHTCF
jgi:hypothetical protein